MKQKKYISFKFYYHTGYIKIKVLTVKPAGIYSWKEDMIAITRLLTFANLNKKKMLHTTFSKKLKKKVLKKLRKKGWREEVVGECNHQIASRNKIELPFSLTFTRFFSSENLPKKFINKYISEK